MDEKQTPRRKTKKWERSTSTMKKRKPFFEKNTNTKTMNRHEQVAVSRLRTGYTRATHSVINKDLSTECPFCAVKITIDHILWDCKKTEITQLQMNIIQEIWIGGKEEMKKLYVKEIGLYNGI
jgi:hypothetical protein